MPRVFLSYRRKDSAAYSGWIHERLLRALGADNVFLDIEDIAAGDDYLASLENEIRKSDYVLVIVGRDWLGILPDGKRRIDDPKDVLRWEVRTAFAERKKLIPILLEGAGMPAEADLPEDIRRFARCEAIPFSHPLFEECIAKLLKDIGAPVQPPRSSWKALLLLSLLALGLTFIVYAVFALLPLTRNYPLGRGDILVVFLLWLSVILLIRWTVARVRGRKVST